MCGFSFLMPISGLDITINLVALSVSSIMFYERMSKVNPNMYAVLHKVAMVERNGTGDECGRNRVIKAGLLISHRNRPQ